MNTPDTPDKPEEPKAPQSKTCNSCGNDKPIADYLPREDAPGEYGNICQACRQAGEKAEQTKGEDGKHLKEAIESLNKAAAATDDEGLKIIIKNTVAILRFLYENHPRRLANLKIKAGASNTAIIADALCASMRITTELLLPQEQKREERIANDTSDLLAEVEKFAKAKQRELLGWVEARRGDMLPLHEDISKLKELITEKKDLVNSIRDERAEVFRNAKTKQELDAGIEAVFKKLNVANDDIQNTFYGKRSVLLHIRQRNVTTRREVENAAGQHNIKMAAKLDRIDSTRGGPESDMPMPE